MTSGERLYPTRPFLAASIAVVRGSRLLVASRVRPPMEALYTLPGGLVEPGETLGAAALRELQEEVGVEAELIGFITPVEIIERDVNGDVRHHFVVCAHAGRWIAGEPAVGPEAGDVRWVTPEEAAGLPTTPGLPGILARALALAQDGP